MGSKSTAMIFPSLTKTWRNAPYPAIDPTRPELSVKGMTVVVTGGGMGIGARVAYQFARAGASHIALIGRTEDTLKASKKAIEDANPKCQVIYAIADIAVSVAVEKSFSTFESWMGKIDICVNNAAYMPAKTKLQDANADDWWRGYEVNVKGSFNVAKAFLRRAADLPFLINVTPGATVFPSIPGFSSYATSKIAGVMMFQYIQAENPHAHVVSIHPGGVMTGMGERAKAAGFDIPEDDIDLGAQFIVWACSREAAFLKNRMVWANWDVDQLKVRRMEIEADSMMLTTGVYGWPYQPPKKGKEKKVTIREPSTKGSGGESETDSTETVKPGT